MITNEVYYLALAAWRKAVGVHFPPHAHSFTPTFAAAVDAAYEAGFEAGREAAGKSIDLFADELHENAWPKSVSISYICGMEDAADIARRGETPEWDEPAELRARLSGRVEWGGKPA